MFSEFAAAHEATSQHDGEQDAMRACTASRTVRWEHGREARQAMGSILTRSQCGDREARCVHTGREIGKSGNRQVIGKSG